MPKGGRLAPAEIDALAEWIRGGAVWPAAPPATTGSTSVPGAAASNTDTGARAAAYAIKPEQRAFWSFQPIRRPAVPAVSHGTWPKSDIDRFIVAKLEHEGLAPVGAADKLTLIRRASLDLTGLPPTPEEIDAFEKDDSPESFAKVVDRLLALQREIRAHLIRSRGSAGLSAVKRTTAADTIYELDAQIDPLVEEFFAEWGKSTPLVLVAEGIYDEHGDEGPVGVQELPPDGPTTAMGWRVAPSSLTELLLRLRHDYGDLPLLITENGASFDDPPVDGGGVVEDPQRVEYLRDHVAAVERAVGAGVDVRGYYVWSLLDNFEWSFGYTRRFGLVHVDFATQRRTLKDSAEWYGRISGQASEIERRATTPRTPAASSSSISATSACGETTTPLPMKQSTVPRRMPPATFRRCG